MITRFEWVSCLLVNDVRIPAPTKNLYVSESNRARVPVMNPIAQHGEKILRGPSKIVTNVEASNVKSIAEKLLKTVVKVNGVGIAANQMRSNLRIFVMASHPNRRYPYAPRMKPLVLINPILRANSNKKEKDWEGCLSVPNIRGLVPRWTSVTVAFTNVKGQKEYRTFKGFLARIFQHEIDHLNGLVYLDRMASNKDLYSQQEFEKRISNRRASKAAKRHVLDASLIRTPYS